MKPIGKRRWAIAEGYIPTWSHGPQPEMKSHETACILNAGDEDAHVRILVFFSDKEAIGPYEITVPARRTKHIRFNDLQAPQPIPEGTEFSSVIESDVRSEEHTSELQSPCNFVCRLLLEKKKRTRNIIVDSVSGTLRTVFKDTLWSDLASANVSSIPAQI